MSMRRPLSLYIHIPFCSKRCGYCHFNTYEGLERLFEPFVDALIADSASHARTVRDAWAVSTIFFGGGTPTHLPLAAFQRLLGALRSEWQCQDEAEITAEANPTHLSPAYLEGLLESGVNRLSLGAQAFDTALLQMLDREHSVEQIGDAVRMARHAGFTNLSLDLMYGLPLQTLAQWRESLDAAVGLEPDHLSLYGLTIDEGTAFKRRVERGLLSEPDPDLAADMYVLAEERLATAGYLQYEISNWAQPCRECNSFEAADFSTDAVMACRHNLTYWHNDPYLGFGPGAHSYFGGRRYWNINPVQAYIERLARCDTVVAGGEEIGTRLEQAETIMLGLRLNEGISRTRFAARFGVPLADVFGTVMRDCAAWELLHDDGERFRLTQRGRLLSNEVFQRLLPD